MNQKNNWWKDFFNQDYYNFWQLTLPPKRTETEVNFIIQTLKLKKGMAALDAPCGQGRHAIGLAKRGIKVIGVDYSKYLLSIAKKKSAGLYSKPTFIHQDIRKIDFNNKFDVILNLFTSFGYFNDYDNELVIKKFYRALKAGGYLFLDLINIDDVLGRLGQSPVIKKIKPNVIIKNNIVAFNPKNKIAHFQWVIRQKNKKDTEFNAYIRLYSYQEARSLLERNGFKIVKVFGNFNGSKYTKISKRMIIIARK